MDETNEPSGGPPPWKGDKAPCVYCGQVIDRAADRCAHCRTSFSMAVRKASREVVGDWFYLDPRNPSGRGVTFETLIKMIEKGRIRTDSIVRGPTTHHDWMYAAEAPRLAKYLGMCPHCFAEAKPEDTFCTACQLNMNQRPAEPRPGVPADLVKEPLHKVAYAMEKELAAEAAPPPPPRPAEALAAPTPKPAPATLRPEPTPSSAAAAAVAAMADSSAALADRPSRVAAAPMRQRPKVWIILILTWVTLVPLALLCIFTSVPLWFVPAAWEDGIRTNQNQVRGAFGCGTATVALPAPVPPVPPPQPSQEWITAQLADADKAEQAHDYAGAIRIYLNLIEKTGDNSWDKRIQELRRKPEQERQARLAKLKERLDLAETMSKQGRYDDALAVLRNIGQDDRTWLISLGVAIDKMETTIKATQVQVEQQKKMEADLAAQLTQAAGLRTAKKLPEALAAYKQIQGAFAAAVVAKHIDLAKTIAEIEALIPATPPTPPTPPEPAPQEAATAIADVLAKVAALEKEEKLEKLTEALKLLEKIKTDFDQKFWPDGLEERIRRIKATIEALNFFGVDNPPAK